MEPSRHLSGLSITNSSSIVGGVGMVITPLAQARACQLQSDTVNRSGTYYYKPDNRHHCCPHYTIRYLCEYEYVVL